MTKLSFVLMAAELSKAESRAGRGSLSKFLLAWVMVSHQPSAAVLALVTGPMRSLVAALYAEQLWEGDYPCPINLPPAPSPPSGLGRTGNDYLESVLLRVDLTQPWVSFVKPHLARQVCGAAVTAAPSLRNVFPAGMWLLSACQAAELRGMLVSWEFTSWFYCWFVESEIFSFKMASFGQDCESGKVWDGFAKAKLLEGVLMSCSGSAGL